MLVNAGLEHKALHAKRLTGGLEAGQYGPPDPLAALIGIDVHPLRLRRRRVEEADGATADGSVTLARQKKRAAAGFEVFRLEVRPEALFGRIELSQGSVQRGDQSSRVEGVERFGGNGQAQCIPRGDNLRANSGACQPSQ
jgi:hypothetical protein